MALAPLRSVDCRPLMRPLGEELIALLRGLSGDARDWERQATARWTVKDVAAHLLDTALRRLTFHRDRQPTPAPDRPIGGYTDLAAFLHKLNADWIDASARFSPRLLTDMLAMADPQLAGFMEGLDPEEPAFFPVAWAGQAESRQWMDVGREYTERWHHQQQIRDAVGAAPLTDARWLRPALGIAVHALGRAWADTPATPGTAVHVEVKGPSGSDWSVVAGDGGWHVWEGAAPGARARIVTDEETAWRLWHRMIDPAVAAGRVRIEGDQALGRPFLSTVALMA